MESENPQAAAPAARAPALPFAVELVVLGAGVLLSLALSRLHIAPAPTVWVVGTLSSLLAATLILATSLILRRPAELRQARQEQIRFDLEAAPTGMLKMSIEGTILMANRRLEQLFGYGHGELLGRHIEVLVPQRFRGHRPRSRESFSCGQDTGMTGPSRELYGLHKDGSEVPIEIGFNPLRTEEGQFVVCSVADITERKRAAEREAHRAAELIDANAILQRKNREVEENERRFRLMVDSIKDYAIFTLDSAGNVTGWNSGAQRIKGYQEQEIIGRHFSTFYTEDDVAAGKPARALNQATTTGRVEDVGWRVRKDQSRFIANVVITALRDDAGELLGFVKVTRDITEQQHAEQGLRQSEQSLRLAMADADRANRAKSEFLANMSHEIRTPLNAVIGLGYLLEQTPLSAEQRQFVAKIEFAGRSLLSVVNNVLDLSKIEAGEMLLEEEQFDLPELLTDIGQMLLPQVAAKGIELAAQVASSLPRWVRGDVTRLRQILTNLVNNAIKFTEAGCVTVEACCVHQDASGIRLRCEVRDTGIGIHAAAIEHLFTPFNQADPSTTRRFGGTGLGLSIARRFVDLMGGEIGVTSAVAVGSTFWFEIPLKLATETSVPKSVVPAPGLRVLVADAAGYAQEGLGAKIRALGWTPEIAATEEELRSGLTSHNAGRSIDVLILGLKGEDRQPAAIFDRIKTGCGDDEVPPIIVVIDAAQGDLQYEPFLRSEDLVLVRPVSNSSLFNAINAAVWRQSGGRERLLQTTNLEELHAQWLVDVRVLVADDSDINLEVARRILEAQGAVVATCADGKAAVDYVRDHALDILLLDVQMPELDGNRAAQQIRSELKRDKLPIIALTAGAMLGERQRSLAAGMDDVISKPFDPLTLIRKVRHLVELARGEPIKMVLVDRPQVTASGGLRMASIDVGVAQQMFGEDLPLFKAVLARILREYADLALPDGVSFAEPAGRDGLMARVHKLKGAAGTIGANRIMHLAGAAENALRHNRPTETVETVLRQLAAAMTVLREEAAPLLDSQPQSAIDLGAREVSYCSGDAVAVLEDLCALLDSRDLAAVGRIVTHAPTLTALLGAAAFAHVREAIDNFDFARGADLLRGARVA